MPEQEWVVEVTDADVRAARDAWVEARYGDAPAERVALLRADLESLWRQQARQVRRDFWAGRPAVETPSTRANGDADPHSR